MTRRYVATGSGIERHMECDASAVLPRVWYESTDDARRGTSIHEHLERLGRGVAPAESLALVPDQHRDAAAAADVDALADDLKLTPEVALAYRPADDTARLLGTGLQRDYSDVGPDEIPLTIDLAGVRNGRFVVKDYKTGHRWVTRAARNWQLLGAALAVSRAFGLDEGEAEIIYVRENAPPKRDHAELTGMDLAAAAAELAESLPRVERDRAAYARGEHIEPTEGEWCRYCPSRWACPAKVGQIQRVLELGDSSAKPTIPAGDLVKFLERLKAGRRAAERLEAAIEKELRAQPVLVDVDRETGDERWLGVYQTEGREVFDPGLLVDTAASILKIDPAEARKALVDEKVTKERLTKLVAGKAARGTVEPTVERILAATRRGGGARKPQVEKVGEYIKIGSGPVGEAA